MKNMNAIRADGKMIAPEVIARIYRHRLFFDRYFSKKYYYTSGGAVQIYQPWWSRVPGLKEIGEWFLNRRLNKFKVEIAGHIRGYHGDKPELPQIEQAHDAAKKTLEEH